MPSFLKSAFVPFSPLPNGYICWNEKIPTHCFHPPPHLPPSFPPSKAI